MPRSKKKREVKQLWANIVFDERVFIQSDRVHWNKIEARTFGGYQYEKWRSFLWPEPLEQRSTRFLFYRATQPLSEDHVEGARPDAGDEDSNINQQSRQKMLDHQCPKMTDYSATTKLQQSRVDPDPNDTTAEVAAIAFLGTLKRKFCSVMDGWYYNSFIFIYTITINVYMDMEIKLQCFSLGILLKLHKLQSFSLGVLLKLLHFIIHINQYVALSNLGF